MGDYMFLGIILLNMILVSKTWPQPKRDNSWQIKDTQKRELPEMDETLARGQAEDDPIIFPDSTLPPMTNRNGDSYSAEGKGFDCIENVCDNAEDYPYEHIRRIMDSLNQYASAFGGLEGNFVNFSSKHNTGEPSEPLCAVSTFTKFPKTLKTESNVEKFIINVDNHKQGVVFETCVKTTSCGDASFPIGIVAECAQKYSTRRLLAVEGKNGNATYDSFIVPSCCVCMITKKQTKK